MEHATIAELHFETFRRHFPVPIKRVIVTDDQMRYILKTNRMAEFCEMKANEVIVEHHLPLEAFKEVWSIGGVVFEYAMVVQFVPEKEHLACY